MNSFQLAFIQRGKDLHKYVQHIMLCRKNRCICLGGPPDITDKMDALLASTIVHYFKLHLLRPLAAECMLPGNIRPDLIFFNVRSKITIFELKTGYRNIMSRTDKMMRKTRTKHLAQLAKYGIAWNNSELVGVYGECDELIIHYPDCKSKPWIKLHKSLWAIYAPPKAPDLLKMAKAAAKAAKEAAAAAGGGGNEGGGGEFEGTEERDFWMGGSTERPTVYSSFWRGR